MLSGSGNLTINNQMGVAAGFFSSNSGGNTVTLNMKTHLIPVFTAVLCSGFLGGCAISSNVNSYYVSGERLELTPVKAPDQGLLAIGPLAVALAPSVINFTTAKLEEIYTKESGKYVTGYSASRVGEDFYKSDTSLELSFEAMELTRYATEKGGREVVASVIRLRWVPNREHSLFALLPEKIVVHKAKAKMRTGDQHLDLSISVSLDGYWQVKNGEIKSKTLGEATMMLKNLRLGEQYSLTGDDEQRWLEDSMGNKSNYNVQSGWLAPVPVSLSDQGNRLEHARGNYALTITVTETDEYGERVARFGRDLHDARGVLTELLEQLE